MSCTLLYLLFTTKGLLYSVKNRTLEQTVQVYKIKMEPRISNCARHFDHVSRSIMWFFNLLLYHLSIYLSKYANPCPQKDWRYSVYVHVLFKTMITLLLSISEAFNLMLSPALSHVMIIWSVWTLILILSYSKTRPLHYTLGCCSKNLHYYATDCWGEIFMNYSKQWRVSPFQMEMCY